MNFKTRNTIVSYSIQSGCEVQKNLSCVNFGDAFYGASNSDHLYARDCNKDVHPRLKSLEIAPDEVNSFGKEVERTCTLVKSFPHKEERLLGKL